MFDLYHRTLGALPLPTNRRLFWKLAIVLAVGGVALIWVITHLAWQTEESISFIASNIGWNGLGVESQVQPLARGGMCRLDRRIPKLIYYFTLPVV